MKLTIRNRNLAVEPSIEPLIENRLLALAGRFPIDDATISLERRSEASPAFRVQLHVAVPGPDICCEQIDHSPLRAFTRALEEVERRLHERTQKRESQRRRRKLRTAGARLGGHRLR